MADNQTRMSAKNGTPDKTVIASEASAQQNGGSAVSGGGKQSQKLSFPRKRESRSPIKTFGDDISCQIASSSLSVGSPRNDNVCWDIKECRQRLFPHASDQEWNDWRWQLRNAATSLESVMKYGKFEDSQRAALHRVLEKYPAI